MGSPPERGFSPGALLPSIAVWLLIGSYIVAFSSLSLQRYDPLSTSGLGLEHADQVVRNILNGHFFYPATRADLASASNSPTFAGDHFQPILVPISLLYLIHSGPKTLLVLQSIVLGLGALPVFWLARERLRGNLGGLVLAVAYLLLPTTGWAGLTDYRSLSLATTALLFAYYCLQRRSYLPFAVFAVLALASREDAAPIVALMGLYALIGQKERRVGLGTVVVSLGWFLLTTLLVIPYYTYSGTTDVLRHYGFLDGSYQSSLVFAIILVFAVHVLGFLTVQLPQRLAIPQRGSSYVLLALLLLASGYYHYEAGASPLAKHYDRTGTAGRQPLAEELVEPRPSLPATAAPATPRPSPTPPPRTCPLCGQEVRDPTTLTLPPLAVKIDNSSGARPQSGLSEACIVYEHLTEWGVTRFTALYLCQRPDNIGPIRSARLIDLDLARQYGAVLVHVGASAPIMGLLRVSGLWDLDQFWYPYAYYRSNSRYAPYNVFSVTPMMQEIIQAMGWQGQDVAGQDFLFDREPAPGGTPASRLEIPFSPYNPVEYRYDEGKGSYLRWVSGEPHSDSDNEQISAANVVVQWVESRQTDIIEDALGARSVQFELTGEGVAEVFRDGQVFHARWVRSNPDEMTKFYDMEARLLPLKPGNIWIVVVPIEMEITKEG